MIRFKSFFVAFVFAVLFVVSCFSVVDAAEPVKQVPANPSIDADTYKYYAIFYHKYFKRYCIIYSTEPCTIENNTIIKHGSTLVYVWSPAAADSVDWAILDSWGYQEFNLGSIYNYYLSSNYDLCNAEGSIVYGTTGDQAFLDHAKSNFNASADNWNGSGSDPGGGGFIDLSGVINALKNVLNSIVSLPGKIVSGIKDMLISLFVPADDYFPEQIEKVKAALSAVLPFEDYIKMLSTISNISSGSLQDIKISIMGVNAVVVDFQWLKQVLPSIRSWVRGLFFVIMLSYHINQLYKLIRGTTLYEAMFQGKGGSD